MNDTSLAFILGLEDRKLGIQLTYAYNTIGWVAWLTDKHGGPIADKKGVNSLDEYGEGRSSMDDAIALLKSRFEALETIHSWT